MAALFTLIQGWRTAWGYRIVQAALIGWLLLAGTLCSAAADKAAELKVTGYGVLGNRQLKKTLLLLEEPGKKLEFFDANFVEDAALILMSRLTKDGFLKPALSAHLLLADGSSATYHWDKAVRDEPLPRPLRVRQLEFRVHKGVLYYFGTLQIRGLTAVPERTAQSYFVEAGALFPFKRTRVFSPDRLQRGISSLVEVLNRAGYESAAATVVRQEADDRTGRMDLTIEVSQGLKSMVRSIRQEYSYESNTNPVQIVTVQTNIPFSKLWLQDYIQQRRATNYHQGYPDTEIEVTQLRREITPDLIRIDLLAQIRGGERVRLGEVHFTGAKRTKESLMERRVRLEPGGWLDRIAVDEGRYRLARLGVFDSVGLTYQPVDEHTRDVTYQVKEGRRIDFSLLFGFGSYELLRGGVEMEQNNIFGRAHHARLRLIQSIKASSGEYIYTLPEFIGRDVDVFFNGSALRREEIDFTREEFGGGLGARKYVRAIESDVTLRYSYQVLSASTAERALEEGLPNANVGAVIAEIRHDRQDNPLYPRKGYKIFGNFEFASEYLAGDVNYQRLELNTAYHQPLDAGRWLHFGLSHGAVLTIGSPAQDLPFNRRFFPGGDNSIRGYQQGEAAPRNAQGKIVGAETYLFGSMEFEQSLTTSWSVVGFFDTVSFAQHLKDYPFDESLFSVGSGIRWKTIIGPVRLEYGYNLNRRPRDPVGTIQFSLGFPF
jgi:outer membrane protein insertion porin family